MARAPTNRCRNFCSILYPEDNENWESDLRQLHVTAVVSPLHTGEKEDGSALKPHFHIVLLYDSVKTMEQAKEDFKSFGAIDRCEMVRAIRSYLRYLCHLDETDPSKPHYDPEQVKVIGDFNYMDMIQSEEDDTNLLIDITNFIHSNHITNLIEFQCFNISHNLDWFRVIARSSTIYVKEIIKAEYLLGLQIEKYAKENLDNTEGTAT